jgi:hypothetical protein
MAGGAKLPRHAFDLGLVEPASDCVEENLHNYGCNTTK